MPNVLGSFELAPMATCSMPDEIAAGFSDVMGSLVGANYIPVLYVGKQVVSGFNYMIICRQTLVVPGEPEHLVNVIINCAPGTNKWSVVSIERIV